LEVASQSVEAVVRIAHGFFFYDGHSALAARVGAWAVGLLVLHDVYALDVLSTVDTRNHDVWTCCLVLVNLLAYTLCLAFAECLALYRLEMAILVVVLHLHIRQD